MNRYVPGAVCRSGWVDMAIGGYGSGPASRKRRSRADGTR